VVYIYLSETESTQIIAKKLINKINKNIGIIAAEKQTAGKGRADRHWDSNIGGLYFTLFFKKTTARLQNDFFTIEYSEKNIFKKIINFKLQYLNALSMLTAIALSKFLNYRFNINPQIKWPNDIFYGNSKLAGILIDITEQNKNKNIFIGIGININNQFSEKSLKNSAGMYYQPISISQILKKEITFSIIKDTIMFSKFFFNILDETNYSMANLIEIYKKNSIFFNKQVMIKLKTGENIEGKVIDFNEYGGLILDTIKSPIYSVETIYLKE